MVISQILNKGSFKFVFQCAANHGKYYNPGEKIDAKSRNYAWKSAIIAPKCTVFKTLYLLDCAL